MYFDYSAPVLPDLSEGISKLGDALTQTLASRRQQRQFEAQQQMQREVEDRKWQQQQNQYDIQNRAANRLEERQNIENARSDAEYQEKTGKKINQALADANPQEAQRIADAAIIVDPKTGQRQKVKLTPGQTPDVGPEPVARPASERPLDAQAPTSVPPELAAIRASRLPKLNLTEPALGPKAQAPSLMTKKPIPDQYIPEVTTGLPLGADPQLRMQRDAMRDIVREQRKDAGSEVDRAAAQQQFDERNADIGKQHDQWLAKKHKAELETTYDLQFGNGPVTHVDPQTQRYASRTQNAADFVASLPEDMRNTPAAQRAHAMVLAGEPPTAAFAAFNKEVQQGTALQATHEEGDLNRTSRENVARIMASRPSASVTLGAERLGDQRLNAAEERIRKLAVSMGAPKDYESVKQLHDATQNITSLNPAAQRGVAFQLARSYQGSGVLSNQDLNQIQGRIAGVGGSLESWVQKAMDGQLGESEQKVLFDAVNMQMRHYDARMQHNRDVAERRMLSPNSSYRGRVSDAELRDMLDAAFPGTASTYEAPPVTRAGGPLPPEAKRKPKAARVQGGPDTSLDELLGAAQRLLNPPKAAQ